MANQPSIANCDLRIDFVAFEEAQPQIFGQLVAEALDEVECMV
ncbi:hypothetical protein [Nostoc sp. FACHB-280]|nr:hypothetical protein [Nostoc sp. FACHB-280]